MRRKNMSSNFCMLCEAPAICVLQMCVWVWCAFVDVTQKVVIFIWHCKFGSILHFDRWQEVCSWQLTRVFRKFHSLLKFLKIIYHPVYDFFLLQLNLYMLQSIWFGLNKSLSNEHWWVVYLFYAAKYRILLNNKLIINSSI